MCEHFFRAGQPLNIQGVFTIDRANSFARARPMMKK
jgi:hypothetical protein